MLLPKLFHYFHRLLILSALALFCTILLGYTSPVQAQTSGSSSTSVASDVILNSHTRSQINLIDFSSALICQLVGIDIINPTQGCLGVNSTTGQIGYSQPGSGQPVGGLMGFAIGGITTTFQPPTSTSQFTDYLANNFGILKPVFAQEGASGSFQSFEFLQQLFIALRDLTFMILVILFIIIGIAIMLRLKIDPRTVMSIQNQIPRIIIGIVLISFSYAIAGFLTDMMWVTTYFGINTVGGIAQKQCPKQDGKRDITEVATRSLYNSPIIYAHNLFNTDSCFGVNGQWSGLSGLSRQVGGSIGDILTSTIIQGLGGNGQNMDIISLDDCSLIDGILHPSKCAKAAAFGVISSIIGIIGLVVVIIAILLALVRLWFTLLKAYVYILLDVISAPLQIGAGLFPGSKMGFSRWIRHLLAYLLVFPATAIILTLASVFALNKDINNGQGAASFLPPFVGNPYGTTNFGAFIAFALILITPELLEMIKDALQVKNSDRATKAIAGGFNRGLAPVSAGLGGLGKEVFGKNKDGGYKIGTQMLLRAGDKIGVTGLNTENKALSKYTGLNKLRAMKEKSAIYNENRMRYSRDAIRREATRAGDVARYEAIGRGETNQRAEQLAEQAKLNVIKRGQLAATSRSSTASTPTGSMPRKTFWSNFKAAKNTTATPPPSPTQTNTPAGGSSPRTAPTPPAGAPIPPTAPIKASWQKRGLDNVLVTTSGTTILKQVPGGYSEPNGFVVITDLTGWLRSKNPPYVIV